MKNQLELFDSSKLEPFPIQPSSAPIVGKRKMASPNRKQIEFKLESLDSALPLNHDARLIWKFVEQLDLTSACNAIISLEGDLGRPAINPEILISLWIYGISQGVVSARKIADYCKDHRGFAWICGGVSVGHHVLSGFRSKFSELFEELVVQTISLLVSNNLLELKEVSQDGVKIHANASKESFRRKKTLKEKTADIRNHIQKLEEQQKNGVFKREEKVKRDRELQESIKKEKNLKKALKELEIYKNQKNENRLKNKKKKLSNKEVGDLRTSTTDPECRNMRMADGSYKLAYNVQISTEVNTELALGVRVTRNGTDGGEMLPMYDELKQKYGKEIGTYLADTGYKNVEDLQELYSRGTSVYMPTNSKAASLRNRVLSGSVQGISEAEKDWIMRMETEEAQAIYNRRIRVSETIHAYFRNHGLGQLLVRGTRKVQGMINLFCLSYNMSVFKRMKFI